MAIWVDFCKTDQGKNLDAKVTAGETALNITKALSAAGRVNPTQLHTLVELPQPKQQLIIGKTTISSDKEVILPIRLSNKGLTESYVMHLLGIFAQDPEEGEILYMVSQASTAAGEEIPAETNHPAFSIQWNHVIKTEDASTITVEVTQAGLQTIEDAEATYAKKTEVLRDREAAITQLKEWAKVPGNLGNGAVAKYDVVPVTNGGTGAMAIADARKNLGLGTVATLNEIPVDAGGTGGTTPLEARNNLGLGNVNNTSDMNKPVSTATQAAINAHSARKDNPHGITKAQLGITYGTAAPSGTASEGAIYFKLI